MKKIKIDEAQYSILKKTLMVENLTEQLETLNESVEEYTIKVKHDDGTKNIKTTASSEDAAKKKIMSAENCPESAIISVTKTEKSLEEGPRTVGTGYHGGLDAKKIGDAGNKKDIVDEAVGADEDVENLEKDQELKEAIEKIQKWNKILLK